ncbi:MAG: bifunctional adenosylcobinamide kinase/adenosylcobinamide-phosphate guanylyltransferase [Nitrospinae bacterium]|nr:bifunctional adenosylcobinamide kinase/adenosylcobinamide-phosphate guanylyltransferase [Nitrospinota bacterium]
MVIGGARGGKSNFALSLAEGMGDRRIYLATAEALDQEMEERIRLHKESRSDLWDTVEEPLEIATLLSDLKGRCDVVVLDCLTLWLSNLIMKGDNTDEVIIGRVEELSKMIFNLDYSIVIVSNEVGMGIVPENRLARRFREIAGMANQILSDAASDVYMVMAGIPVKIK